MAIGSSRIVTPHGVRPGWVVCKGGMIEGVRDQAGNVDRTVDVADAVVMAGVVDTHVHINEPGRAEWEGFETATCAAAAGGVTTLVDMPLNSVPATTTVAGLAAKRRAAAEKCSVDVGLWGGVVPGNIDELPGLIDGGVLGLKCFLSPSGVDEFENAREADIRAAAPVLVAADLPLLVHAEDPTVLAQAPSIERGHEQSYAAYLSTRPAAAERRAIEMLIRVSEQTGLRVHVVHVADGDAIALIAAAKACGVAISAETCQHYLTFAAEDVPSGGTQFKCAPPIREREHRERLWQALKDGSLDLIASDHSPSPAAGKCLESGDFGAAWGGIASLQLGLAAAWTGASSRGFGLGEIARWLCAAPAQLAGLGARKGWIAPGYDADLVVWRPEGSFMVRGASLEHRHALTAYEGMTLRGIVESTFVRGVEVYRKGRIHPGHGRLINREMS